jgi:phospholipid/cholesterol/gamma-HCH transport system substrate-binding protein
MRIARWLSLTVVAALVATSCAVARGGSGREVVGYFRDVGDLVSRATVQINDVKVGSVRQVDLVLSHGDMLARVTMAIDDEVQVPVTGLAAVVRQTSLLGEQFVELVPATTGPPFLGPEGAEVPLARTSRRADVETFLSDLSAFVGGGGLEDLNRFTHAQALILEGRGERFGESLTEFERFTGVLAGRRAEVETAIDSLAGAAATLAANRDTMHRFLDSLDEANVLLAEQAGDFRRLFTALNRFGRVNSRFLARHERGIERQFAALRPIFEALASVQNDLKVDITQLATFLELFPKSLGGGPGGRGSGDYVQVDAAGIVPGIDAHSWSKYRPFTGSASTLSRRRVS